MMQSLLSWSLPSSIEFPAVQMVVVCLILYLDTYSFAFYFFCFNAKNDTSAILTCLYNGFVFLPFERIDNVASKEERGKKKKKNQQPMHGELFSR